MKRTHFTSPHQPDGLSVKSPYRYPGGKYYAVKYIMPFLLCVDHNEYREPFVGGGSLFFAKPKCPINWINDLEPEIINTYQAIADSDLCEELIERVTKEVASKERHTQIKTLSALTKLDRAFKTYYLNRTSYSGIIKNPSWGYRVGKSSPPTNWGAFLENAHKKLKDVKITSMDFDDVMSTPSNNQVLVYLDPPYYHAGQKRAYIKSFTINDHIRLANTLRKTRFSFCLSYDECPEIRDLYSWANIQTCSWNYNIANSHGKKRTKGNELIITNYTVSHPQQKMTF